MIIGWDYDDTWTEDPELWHRTACELRDKGHTNLGTTLRNKDQIITCPLYLDVCKTIIYCSGVSKKDVTKAAGFKVDIWIDDKPEYVCQDWSVVNGYRFDPDHRGDGAYRSDFELLKPFMITPEGRTKINV